jgi:ankyrin repeat protein
MIRILLKQPTVDINYQGAVRIIVLVVFVVQVLNGFLVPTAQSGRTALHLAVQKGHYDVVRLLLRRGASTELRNLVSKGTLCCGVCMLQVCHTCMCSPSLPGPAQQPSSSCKPRISNFSSLDCRRG